MYSVLKFPDPEDPTEIVPTSWINEITMTTKWPPYKQPEKILTAIRKCIIPEDNWIEYTYARVMYQCGKLQIFLVFYEHNILKTIQNNISYILMYKTFYMFFYR